MKATKKVLLLTALALPATAFANEGAHIDAYYIPSSTLEFDFGNGVNPDDDGDGFGAKAFVPFGRTQSFFLEGEYQSTSFDDFDYDVDQLRLGGGWQTPVATGTFGLYGEYAKLSIDDADADGFGIHGRLAFPISRGVQLYGQVGYLSLEDDSNSTIDGVEFLVGGSVDFSPNIGAFIDYRYDNLQDDEDIKYKFGDVRVGIRVLFDTGRI